MDFKSLDLTFCSNKGVYIENDEHEIQDLAKLNNTYDIIYVYSPLGHMESVLLANRISSLLSDYFGFQSDEESYYFVNKKIYKKYGTLFIRKKSDGLFCVKTIKGDNVGYMCENEMYELFKKRLPLLVFCSNFEGNILDNYFTVLDVDCGNFYLIKQKGLYIKAAIK